MKSFNSINETIEEPLAVNDIFDTDITSPVDLDIIQEENDTVESVEDVDTAKNTDLPAEDLEENKEECTALVVTKPNSLFVAQRAFKKSIKISIKSFLISLSLGFLNLFF